MAASGVSPAAVLGIGVGVPGIVENGPDGLVHGQTYGWESVPLGRLLRAGTTPAAAHRQRRQDHGTGRAVVRRRARRPERGGLPGRFRRGGEHQRQRGDAARPYLERERMGAHHRHGRRPALPVRVTRLPRGLRRRRGDSRAVRRPAAGRPGGRAGGDDRAGPGFGAGGGDPGLHRALPGRRHREPDQPVQPRADHPRRMGRPAPRRAHAACHPARRPGTRSLRHLFAETSIELGRLGPDAVALGAATLPIEAFLGGSVFTGGEAASPLG